MKKEIRKNRSIKFTDEEWAVFRKYKLQKLIRQLIKNKLDNVEEII